MRKVFGALVTSVLPHRCLRCNQIVGTPGFCGGCWLALPFLGKDLCEACGIPIPTGECGMCAECLRIRPFFSSARSVFIYNEVSKGLVLKLKNADQTFIAKYAAPWLVRVGQAFLPQIDVIIPVPLHWQRLWMRQYNQANLLAQHLGRAAHLPVIDALKVLQKRPSQQTLLRAQRLKNLNKTFGLRKKLHLLEGRTCLLLDDVLTTGATANACARVLLQARAKQVYVLTLARTVYS